MKTIAFSFGYSAGFLFGTVNAQQNTSKFSVIALFENKGHLQLMGKLR